MSPNAKRGLGIGLAAVVVGFAGWQVWRQVGGGESVQGHYRVLMDSETGEIVRMAHDLDTGSYPLVNSATGKPTLFPTEACFWNQCAAEGGTRVILNRWFPDRKDQPTLCPKCGREVVRRNPVPPEMRHRAQDGAAVDAPLEVDEESLSNAQSTGGADAE